MGGDFLAASDRRHRFRLADNLRLPAGPNYMQNRNHDFDAPGGVKSILRDVPRPLWALLVLAVLFPALLAGWFAWHRHAAALDEARLMAQRSVVALEQHMGNVLQTHTLLLSQIADRTQGRPWSEIESDRQLLKTVAELPANFEQVSSIGIADADGRLRISSAQQPVEGVTIADRDYFIAHKSGAVRGIFFSEPFTGRINGVHQFAISLARTGPSGEFDGIVFAAVSLDYFKDFWKQFVPSGGYLIPVIREDGMLLVRYPTEDIPQRLNPNGPFLTQIRRAPVGLYSAVSQVDGIERINAYSQVKNYPLYISFSVETDTALQNWRDEMLPALILAIVAAVALLALSFLVIRQSHLQRQAGARWQRIARNLEDEIARREAAEEQLRQAQKMEAFGQLTGGIAHDFNNMLASIVGNLELIRAHLLNGGTGAISKCVDRAEAVADRAASMIQRLLTFARRKTLKSVPVNINTLLRSATDMFEDAVGPNVRIATVLPDASPVALCDPVQLETALLNLVINSRDAMPNGGRITITASSGELVESDETAADPARPPSGVIISVSDNGVGMSQDVIDRAFEPFFTTKGIGEGSGLGLSMVFGFVQQSGGNVTIHSSLHGGTTVTLRLPVYEGEFHEDAPAALHAALPNRRFSGTVLLVEDDTALRHVLAEVLRQSGATALVAGNAEEGLKMLAQNPEIALIVTDIGLPGELSGYEFADAARRMRAELPFLFISGYSKGQGGAETAVRPHDRLMHKPFKAGVFLDTLAGMRWNENRSKG